jgi:DNA-binding winged helix-turn-helix (wHTH) protein/Tol biopolymer transport system component
VTEHKCFVFNFADVEVREREFSVIKSGEVLSVEPKAFRVLLFLLRNPHKLITKDQLLDAVWNDISVSENSLTRSIALLRRVLGDDTHEPRYIATVPTIGYRFLCDVQVTEDGFVRLDTGDPLPQPAKTEEQPKQPSESRGKKSAGLLVVGLVVAALVILVAGSLVRRTVSKHDVVGQAFAHQATEMRVTSNPPEAPVKGAVISPDGKYVAYTDSTGLYLRQVSSGEIRPWGVPNDFIVRPDSWFPDSTHLLVTHFEGAAHLSLWKLSLLGGSPQMLMDNAIVGMVSPDGSRIAYLPGPDFGSELWLMDSDGANPRKIADTKKPGQPSTQIWSMAWSPGGQRIAYIENGGLPQPTPGDNIYSLRTRDANGGDLQVVLDDARLKQPLSWAADGRILYAYTEGPTSERIDQGVHAISVDERTGKPTGQPQTISLGQGRVGGLSVTSDGKRLVLWRENTQTQAFITEFEAGSRRMKTPRRLTLDANGNVAEAWTPDSKAVLFVSNRNGTWKLFKQNIDEITAEVLVEGRSLFLPRLSADGSEVLYGSYPRLPHGSLPASLMRKPLAGGPPQVVLQEQGLGNFQCARAPSQLCIFSKLVGSKNIFVSFDPQRGAGREITTAEGWLNWTLSPDGKVLAIFIDQHRIRFLSLVTGVARDIAVDKWPISNGDWSADGKSIFVPSLTSKATSVILDVNEAGKAEVVLEGEANTNFWFLIQSPDGSYGILGAEVPGDNNAWMVENF